MNYFVYICNYLFFSITLFSFASCQKDAVEINLPPETATGANTFGCILNGEAWVSKQGMGPNYHVMCILDSDNSFALRGFFETATRDEEISFFSTNIASVGSYPIKKGTPNRVLFIDDKKNTYTSSRDSDVIEDGILTITTFDIARRIVAGKFWFKLQKADGTVIEAIEGRFDAKAN
jgi:hypothetical protein